MLIACEPLNRSSDQEYLSRKVREWWGTRCSVSHRRETASVAGGRPVTTATSYPRSTHAAKGFDRPFHGLDLSQHFWAVHRFHKVVEALGRQAQRDPQIERLDLLQIDPSAVLLLEDLGKHPGRLGETIVDIDVNAASGGQDSSLREILISSRPSAF